MTDRGQFELLVVSVLHKVDRDYPHILQTGVNAAGEPVKSPVDGFCRAPGSRPPHFLILQTTSTDRRELKRKWLYDGTSAPETKAASKSTDGDLIKAGRLAQEIRKEFPKAKFTVILATNQRPDMTLLQSVHEKEEEFDVMCDIWDQSRLSDFLDNTSEGHWLRKQYLGIDAEMLSESLLQSLCMQSLTHYEREFLLSVPDSWVQRQIEDEVQGGICSNRYTIQFLVGESGFGKSVTAYRALQNHLQSGGYGLWAPASLVNECLSLEEVISKVLQALHPHLSPEAGRVALQLVREGSQLLIVLDDVNRAEAPTRLLHRILSWSRPQPSTIPDSPSSVSQHIVVCPVWPHIWGQMEDNLTRLPWIHTIIIGPMTLAEATLAVRVATSHADVEISSAEASDLATKMGRDPVMIGLLSSLLTNAKQSDLNVLAEDVVENFVTSSLKDAASAPGASYLSSDYRKALSTTCLHMLRKREHQPSWEEIKRWLGENSNLKAMRELIRRSMLCRLRDQEELVFRHDRILETLLVGSMVTILTDSMSDSEVLEEPYYAGIIGRALLISPQHREFLAEMRNRNPLSLVEAIRCFGIPTSSNHKAIIGEVKQWMESGMAKGATPDSVINAVCWSLLETDSPAVLEVTERLRAYPLVLLARLRNGCAESGASYFGTRGDFAPGINDGLRDRILDHAKMKHREQLLRELKMLLISSTVTDRNRKGSLALAGFLGLTDLQDEIAACWRLSTDRIGTLPEAIWAATQCSGANPSDILDPLMACWASLPDEENTRGISPKVQMAKYLRFALARGIRDDVIDYLVKQCDVHESLRWPITFMCDKIDTPNAIEFIVRSAARIEREIAGTERFSPWTAMIVDNWNNSRRGGRRLSQASWARLRALWENPQNDEFVKTEAFRLWLTNVEWTEIDILRVIPQTPPLFHRALWKRAQLGDQSVVRDILPLLSTETHWFSVAHYVWCNEIMNVAERHLESFKDNISKDFMSDRLDIHYMISRLLMMIPARDAEILLTKYWNHLGYSPLFIQTALYVGTPKCLELASSSIIQCPNDVPVFKHIDFHFGFLDSERQKYLTVGHLENLVPYLDRLGEHDLRELAEVCQRLGVPEWSQQHLSNLLSEKLRRDYHPSDDELLQDLNEFLADRHGKWRVGYWLEEFDKRHDSRDRALDLVDRWLASHPTIEGLEIAATCVQAIGTREDLLILEKHKIAGPSDVISKIRASARFHVQRRTLE